MESKYDKKNLPYSEGSEWIANFHVWVDEDLSMGKTM